MRRLIHSELRTLGHKEPMPQLCCLRRRNLLTRTVARSARTPCGKSTARRWRILTARSRVHCSTPEQHKDDHDYRFGFGFLFAFTVVALEQHGDLVYDGQRRNAPPRLSKTQQGFLVVVAGCNWPLRSGKATVWFRGSSYRAALRGEASST